MHVEFGAVHAAATYHEFVHAGVADHHADRGASGVGERGGREPALSQQRRMRSSTGS